MYFLRKLTKLHADKTLITLFNKSIVQSVLSFCVTTWGGNCGVKDKKGSVRKINRACVAFGLLNLGHNKD